MTGPVETKKETKVNLSFVSESFVCLYSLLFLQDTRRRVKLYVLNEKRSWDDRGTGHVTCAFSESCASLALTVRSEVDGSVLLDSRIQPDIAYQKQQVSLFVWALFLL